MKLSTVVLILGGIILGYLSIKLLLVALVIGTIYYLTKRYENFSNIATFLTADEMKDLIEQDKDGFLFSLTKYDLIARKVQSSIEYKEKAKKLTSNFTEDEKRRIERIIKSIKYKDLTGFGINNDNWNTLPLKFGKCEYEEGYPHTRGDVIILNNRSLSQPDSELADTIIHEKVHIYQKKYPDSVRAYLISKGFTIEGRRDSHPRARANPDLDDYIYKSPEGHIHISEYTSEYPAGIWDITGTTESEHPLEMLAYLISKNY